MYTHGHGKSDVKSHELSLNPDNNFEWIRFYF